MKKKDYMQPTMEVVDINMNAQILAGSVTGVATTGLDDELVLPSGGDPISGALWDSAW
jgi:hypothetical protein